MWFEETLVNLLNRRESSMPGPMTGYRIGQGEPLTAGAAGPVVLPKTSVEHSAVFGRSGCGKTHTFLRLMAEHWRFGVPFLFIDFHGHAVDELMAIIGRDACSREVLLLEPWSDPVLGWNPLERKGEWPYAIVQELVSIFHRRLWPDAWGPRLEECIRYTLLALCEGGHTLVETTKFLSNQDFRRSVLKNVTASEVLEYWIVRFERLAPSQKLLVTESVLNKASAFLDPILQRVLGQRESTLDLDRALRSGQTIIANFSSGKLRGNNYLLAALLVAAFKNAVYRRSPDAPLYAVFLDEFQELVALDALDDYLRSFRKFRCSVYLATQHLQFDPALRAAIFGNCSRFFCFAVSAADARYLAAELGSPDGKIAEEILPDLPTGQAVLKVRGKRAVLLKVAPVASHATREAVQRGRTKCLTLGFTKTQVDAGPPLRLKPAREPRNPAPHLKPGKLLVMPRLKEGYEDIKL